LAAELKKRCIHLRAIRTLSSELHMIEPAPIWTAFVMMLENEGKNEKLLLEYALIVPWLKEYWAAISSALEREGWPSNTLIHSVCMWLLCNFYPKGNYGQEALKVLVNVMKIFSVGAHYYPIGHLPWTDYTPREGGYHPPSYEMTLYGEQVKLTPLPIAIPATISYLSIAETLENKNQLSAIGNNLGDTEWNRVLGLVDNKLSKVHTIGSLEGVWEGAFTYTDFMAYDAFLRGSSSSIVVRTPFARHRQTFKAREYVVFEPTALRVGDTLDAFLPRKPTINKIPSGIEIEGVEYLAVADLTKEQKEENLTVQDVVILGEGHSSWGQFRILGRVRPCDGLVSILKDYTEDDRGMWLYRGYLVGDADGIIVGRWRDTFSPPAFLGYEGSFMMTRRK